MKFSVVVATYRRLAYVRQLIASLEKQRLDHDDFELILVSDGPDGALEQYLTARENTLINLRYCFLPVNRGPAFARNTGASLANGSFLAFTDDDCQPDPVWLEAYDAATAACAGCIFTGRVKVPLSDRPRDYERNTAGLESAEFITANCLVSAKVFRTAGMFDTRFRKAWREDSDLHFTLLEMGHKIVKVEEALVIHSVRNASWGISLKEQSKGIYEALLYKKHKMLYKRRIAATPPLDYYLMLFALVTLIFSEHTLQAVAFTAWAILYFRFVARRLNSNSLAPKHVAEMLITSLMIPFLSIFWRIRGAFRFNIFFL